MSKSKFDGKMEILEKNLDFSAMMALEPYLLIK
jgi:hypothetical protein